MDEVINASQSIIGFISLEEAKQYIDSHTVIKIDEALIKEEIENFKINEYVIAQALKDQESFCVKCGNCCKICDPIDVSKNELKKIASYLKINYSKFKQQYPLQWKNTRLYGLKGKPCPFLNKHNLCLIYNVRPMVCRIYPIGTLAVDMLEKKPIQIHSGCSALKEIFLTVLFCNVIMNLGVRQGWIPKDENGRRELSRQLLKEVNMLDMSPEFALRSTLKQKIKNHESALFSIQEMKNK